MAEKPSASQSLVDGDWTSRSGEGRAEDRGPKSGIGLTGSSKSAIKQPHFSITPEKLREALFYRWKSALAVGLILAAIGATVAWFTYKPKYTAIAMMRMTSSKPHLIPGHSDDGGASREEGFQKTQVQLLRARKVLEEVL